MKPTKINLLIVLLFILTTVNVQSQDIFEAALSGNLEMVRHLVADTPQLLDDKDENGNSPLHCAILGMHSEVARWFINNGADVNARNAEGESVLFSAANKNLEEIELLLIESGADVKNDANSSGLTPLALATIRGQDKIVKLMLENGSDPNMKSDSGRHPLFYAATYGFYDIAKMLLDYGIEVNTQDIDGKTSLHRAVIYNNDMIVELLLKYNADAGIPMKDGSTPFTIAVMNGNPDLVRLFINKVHDINRGDSFYGRTSLHIAAIKGYEDIAQMLLANGADVNKKDNSGNTPLFYAAKYGNKKVFDLIKHLGGHSEIIINNFSTAKELKERVEPGEAVIWYLGHSGWAIKTETKFLIFDYYEYGKNPDVLKLANGHINPNEIKNLDTYIFVTHAHGDHYDTIIHNWESRLKNVKYIFGWNTSEDRHILFNWKRETRKIDDFEVTYINSEYENEGAFLVKTDGLTIYHGGDYYVKGDDKGNLDFLAERYGPVDLAFVMYESGDSEKGISKQTLSKLNPRVFFPMHKMGEEYLYPEHNKVLSALFTKTQFVGIENRGDKGYYLNDHYISK